MNTPHARADVIVVGAGPVGLLLAGELARAGAGVLVLEKRRSPSTASRASTLHARTMEILDSRGLLADLGDAPREPRGHFGGIPLDLTLPAPHPGQYKVPQTRTEAVLEEWALALGADIRCGHELTALTDHGHHVTATAAGRTGELHLSADYLVACDGQDSTVRHLTGAAFPGQDATRELLRADVADIRIPNRRFERLDGGLAIAARRGDGVTRVMAHAFGAPARPRTEDARFTEITQVWKQVTGEDISHGTPLWVNSFNDACRQLTHYRHGRILFAGDAAHQQMPIGGQALNLGLQDAFNLGWKLAAVARGTAPDTLLDTYHRERHTAGARTLANIRAQALMLLGDPGVEPLRAVLGELITLDEVRTHLAGMISGLDVHYPDPTGGDAGDQGHPLQGRRLPETELNLHTHPTTTTTTALLREHTGGLLLDLRDNPAPGLLPAGYTGAVHPVTARPTRPGPLDAHTTWLIRPDGHVAHAGDGRGDGLHRALATWFGPPR